MWKHVIHTCVYTHARCTPHVYRNLCILHAHMWIYAYACTRIYIQTTCPFVCMLIFMLCEHIYMHTCCILTCAYNVHIFFFIQVQAIYPHVSTRVHALKLHMPLSMHIHAYSHVYTHTHISLLCHFWCYSGCSLWSLADTSYLPILINQTIYNSIPSAYELHFNSYRVVLATTMNTVHTDHFHYHRIVY